MRPPRPPSREGEEQKRFEGKAGPQAEEGEPREKSRRTAEKKENNETTSKNKDK